MTYHPAWTVLGLLVLLVTFWDLVVTTLLLSGAGALSGPLMRWAGNLAMRIGGGVSKFVGPLRCAVSLLIGEEIDDASAETGPRPISIEPVPQLPVRENWRERLEDQETRQFRSRLTVWLARHGRDEDVLKPETW